MNAEKRFFVLSVAMPVLVLAAFLLGYFVRPEPAQGDLAVVQEAYEHIRQRYYGAYSPEEVRGGAIAGMARALDPHSVHLSTEEWNKFEEDVMKGEFSGVGIVVEPDEEHGYVVVVTTIPGTPAGGTEILPGDRITHVDRRSLKNQGLDRAVQWIRGLEGSEVTLSIWRKDRDPFDLKILRAMIKVPAIRAKMLDRERGLAYIRVIKFQELMDEFDQKIAELEKEGMKALVVDLRFNGGGLLEECCRLSDRFLDSGVIVTTRARGGEEDGRKASAEATRVRVPVVVLVNGSTASASEIFAGALQDHGRAAIVGSRSYGKGSVQTPIPLSDGSRLKITTARYYTPKGRIVHREKDSKEWGIEPDYVVQTTAEESVKIFQSLQTERYGSDGASGAKDPQLEAALEVLRARLESREPKVEPRLVEKGDENPRD